MLTPGKALEEADRLRDLATRRGVERVVAAACFFLRAVTTLPTFSRPDNGARRLPAWLDFISAANALTGFFVSGASANRVSAGSTTVSGVAAATAVDEVSAVLGFAEGTEFGAVLFVEPVNSALGRNCSATVFSVG